MLDVSNGLNFDLGIGHFLIRFDDQKIRMRARIHLAAGSTGATRVWLAGVRDRLAEQRLRQSQGEEPFADAVFAVKEIRMGQPVLQHRRLQQRLRVLVSDDVSEGHGGPVWCVVGWQVALRADRVGPAAG